MAVLYPVEYAKRQADKLHYRYPGVGGESYLDVIERVRPVIIGTFCIYAQSMKCTCTLGVHKMLFISVVVVNTSSAYFICIAINSFLGNHKLINTATELERQRRSIVIVGHIAVLRCVYAYFMGVPLNDIPFQDFRFHHIYELAPGN